MTNALRALSVQRNSYQRARLCLQNVISSNSLLLDKVNIALHFESPAVAHLSLSLSLYTVSLYLCRKVSNNVARVNFSRRRRRRNRILKSHLRHEQRAARQQQQQQRRQQRLPATDTVGRRRRPAAAVRRIHIQQPTEERRPPTCEHVGGGGYRRGCPGVHVLQ